jgi:hypothetical protein
MKDRASKRHHDRGMEPNPYEAPRHYANRPKSLLVPWAIALFFVACGVVQLALGVLGTGSVATLSFAIISLFIGCLAAWGLSRSDPNPP